MINAINYILGGFGYRNGSDFKATVFKILTIDNTKYWVLFCSACATLRTAMFDFTGLDSAVLGAFVILIGAEYWTGIKVAYLKKGERFKSRKFGRMILKIGTYIVIIMMLHAFARKMSIPIMMGFTVNPFLWLYYFVFIAIVFQLLISYLENLGSLGYKETRTIAGLVLRKFNKWFEFDGTKDNGPE